MRVCSLMMFLGATLAAQTVLAGSVTPVRAIRSQSILTAADLTMLDEDVPGALGDISEAVGLEAKVTLYAGRPIQSDQIGPPAVIERNEMVRMRYVQGLLTITTDGRALGRAGVGERVRVMNLESRQIVSGAVVGDGTIEVGK